MAKKIICTVTTDLNYDQRMIRICNSLHSAGYDVWLVGRKKKKSEPLVKRNFHQKRFSMFFEKGKFFYIEYNIRLFLYLFFHSFDAICSIDLDSILPGYIVSKFKNKKRVFDAHELFCEMEEILSRPKIYKVWKWIESHTVPHFEFGYTIGFFYQKEFEKLYNKKYEIVRNTTLYQNQIKLENKKEYILYQGAVNEGRCFEQLIPAMKNVNFKMIICGEGNFFNQTKQLIIDNKLEHKISMLGYKKPEELKKITANAICGITLFTNTSKSNYYSCANRFFDYMHAGVPQLAMDFPEYKFINNPKPFGILISKPDENEIAKALNKMIMDNKLWNTLHENALAASELYNWQNEEKKLLSVWTKVFA